MSAACFVYIIGREEGPVKVGISRNPAGRLDQIKAGCPFEIDVICQASMPDRSAAFAIEYAFHSSNSDRRLSGEWFEMDWESAADAVDVFVANYMDTHYPGRPY